MSDTSRKDLGDQFKETVKSDPQKSGLVSSLRPDATKSDTQILTDDVRAGVDSAIDTGKASYNQACNTLSGVVSETSKVGQDKLNNASNMISSTTESGKETGKNYLASAQDIVPDLAKQSKDAVGSSADTVEEKSKDTTGAIEKQSKDAVSNVEQKTDTANVTEEKSKDVVDTTKEKSGETAASVNEQGKTLIQNAQEMVTGTFNAASKTAADLANTISGETKR